MSLDASAGAFLVQCRSCAFRGMAVTRDAARELIDRHRADAHPRQAQYVASKRKTRAAARTAGR